MHSTDFTHLDLCRLVDEHAQRMDGLLQRIEELERTCADLVKERDGMKQTIKELDRTWCAQSAALHRERNRIDSMEYRIGCVIAGKVRVDQLKWADEMTVTERSANEGHGV